MKTDYKFWYILREDNVHVSECAIRIYEGDVTTKSETIKGITNDVTRYRRSRRIPPAELAHFNGRATRVEFDGSICLVFTDEDFGVITTEDELSVFLNGELKKDASRTPIPDQA